jgi:hypothetical protein
MNGQLGTQCMLRPTSALALIADALSKTLGR